jgi:hypothetical protein
LVLQKLSALMAEGQKFSLWQPGVKVKWFPASSLFGHQRPGAANVDEHGP